MEGFNREDADGEGMQSCAVFETSPQENEDRRYTPMPLAGENVRGNPVWFSGAKSDAGRRGVPYGTDEDRVARRFDLGGGDNNIRAEEEEELLQGKGDGIDMYSEYYSGNTMDGVVRAAMGNDRPEEESFEASLRRFVTGETRVAESLAEYRNVCMDRAGDLKSLASSQLQETGAYVGLSKYAEELEAEGSTWNLLLYLFGDSDRSFPAGRGGDFVQGAGFEKTYRQHVTDLVFQDEVLNRAARAVAWLEAEAVERDPEPGQGLVQKDGVWQETRAALKGKSNNNTMDVQGGSMVEHIDPDAMTREGAGIHPDNAKDEERLGKMVWRFVRSGRVYGALNACHKAGQSWRCVSLAAGGSNGPLPLGQAAIEADETETGALQAEILAGEVESAQSIPVRSLWRWACYSASEKIGESASDVGHGKYEAAVYGLLSANVKRIVPACSSWEDVLWATLRCWLEYHVDKIVLQELQCHAEDQRGTANDLGPGLVAPRLDVDEFNNAVQLWPSDAISREIPDRLEEAVSKGSSEFGGLCVDASNDAKRYRKIQTDIIIGDSGSLLETLVGWISPKEDTADEGPPCPPGIMRFAAHLALLFKQVGMPQIEEDPGESTLYSKFQDVLQRLVWVYAVHLIDSASFSLVPIYLVHLRPGLRRTTSILLLEQASWSENIPMCRKMYGICRQWFAKFEGTADISQDEIALVVSKTFEKARTSVEGGPLRRALMFSWLCFDPSMSNEAIQKALILCRDFCLCGSGGIEAGCALLKHVIPAATSSDGLFRLIGTTDVSQMNQATRELLAWERYYELCKEFAAWEEIYGAAVQKVLENVEEPTEALRDLGRETIPLYAAMTEFVLSETYGWISDSLMGPEMADMEATIILAPPESNSADPATNTSSVYPSFTDSQIESVAKSISNLCSESFDEAQLSYAIGPALDDGNVHLPGLLEFDVWTKNPEHATLVQDASAKIMIQILKGELKVDGLVDTKFMATNLSVSCAVSAMLCRATTLPRIVLHIAALREALAYMGQEFDSEIVDIIRKKAQHGWMHFFSKDELEDLENCYASGSAILAEK
eukprot:jgi/Picsp_1/2873/NSC_01098-R1_nuclear pore protein 84 107 containing expressed